MIPHVNRVARKTADQLAQEFARRLTRMGVAHGQAELRAAILHPGPPRSVLEELVARWREDEKLRGIQVV